MKKLIIGVLAIVLIVGVALFSQLDTVVKTGVETAGPDVLSVDVSVGSVSISPFSGKVAVRDFAVGQPDGFGEGPLVSLGALDMKVETSTLMDEHIIIDEIIVDQPMFDARVVGNQSNFQVLQSKLETMGGDSSVDGQAVTLTIRKLAVRSPQISVSKDGILSVNEDIELADFTLTDLGTDEAGLAPREIARHIMDTLQPQIMKALVTAGVSDSIKSLAGEARGELEKGVGGLLDKLRKKNKNDGGGNN